MTTRQRRRPGLRKTRRSIVVRQRATPAFVAYWGKCSITGRRRKFDSTVYYQVKRFSGNRDMVRWLPKTCIENQTYEGMSNAYRNYNVS